MNAIWNSLKEQGVDSGLLGAIREFKESHPVEEKLKKRIQTPMLPYYVKETFEMAAAALLQG